MDISKNKRAIRNIYQHIRFTHTSCMSCVDCYKSIYADYNLCLIFFLSLSLSLSLSFAIFLYTHLHTNISVRTYIYIYMYIWVFIYTCTHFNIQCVVIHTIRWVDIIMGLLYTFIMWLWVYGVIIFSILFNRFAHSARRNSLKCRCKMFSNTIKHVSWNFQKSIQHASWDSKGKRRKTEPLDSPLPITAGRHQ